MNYLHYLLEANLYLAILYAIYYLLLRRDTRHQLNRAYLYVISIVAFIIPLMQLGILKPMPVTAAIVPNANALPVQVTDMVSQPQINIQQTDINYYLLAYGIISLGMLILLCYRLYSLLKLARKNHQVKHNGFRLIEVDGDEQAFSFFNYLFINKQVKGNATIIQHELVHIRQKHSLDVMYTELLKITCWFNPAVYLMQNSLKELHEYIADERINHSHEEINQYTDFLISNAYGAIPVALTNNFFNKNLLKNRIMMLHQKRSGYLAGLKYLVIAPVCAGLLCVSTLAFAKNYSLIDLAPAGLMTKSSSAVAKPELIQNKKIVPPPPTIKATTNKHYNYKLDGYLVDGKTDFRVTITDKNGNQKSYFRSKCTPAQLRILNEKYGFSFPKITLHDKMPPPPPTSNVATSNTNDDSTNQPFDDFYKFIMKNVHYPASERDNNIGGKVYAVFTVDENQKINAIKILRSASITMSNEVVRVLKDYTNFQHASPNVIYTIPISFSIQDHTGNYIKTKIDSKTAGESVTFGNLNTDSKPMVSLNEVVVMSYK